MNKQEKNIFVFVYCNISKTLQENYLQSYSTVKSFRHLCVQML